MFDIFVKNFLSFFFFIENSCGSTFVFISHLPFK